MHLKVCETTEKANESNAKRENRGIEERKMCFNLENGMCWFSKVVIMSAAIKIL